MGSLQGYAQQELERVSNNRLTTCGASSTTSMFRWQKEYLTPTKCQQRSKWQMDAKAMYQTGQLMIKEIQSMTLKCLQES